MVFNGGRALVTGRRKLGIVFALFAALFAFGLLAFLVFAAPAWAQNSGSGDLADEQADENQGQDTDQDNRIEELIIDEDCDVGRDAVIVFEDQNGDRFTVENRNNVRIREINDQVVVEDLAGPQEQKENDEDDDESDQDIEFIVGGDPDGDGFRELRVNRELTVVRSSGIECRNNGGGGGDNDDDNDGTDDDNDGVDDDGVDDDDVDDDNDGIADTDEDLADAEADLNALDDETTDGESTTTILTPTRTTALMMNRG